VATIRGPAARLLATLLVCAGVAAPERGGARAAAQSGMPARPTPIALLPVASGFARPVDIAFPNDSSDRMFVAEQAGRIRIVDGGEVRPAPFLDLGAIVHYDANESGLLALAFHPQYASNGFFFVSYVRASTLGGWELVLARYRASADPDVADPASAVILLISPQPTPTSPIHYGGKLMFGPEGYLYLTRGDGASGDPRDNAQNVDSLLGKILRLDVNRHADTPPYHAIPSDNPYVGLPGDDRIWSLGLRNPWRASFDRQTGDMFVGDVGQASKEEVNFQPAGVPALNFGWSCFEGTSPYNNFPQCSTLDWAPPIIEYTHAVGRGVTGGYRHRGAASPALAGTYLYADYVGPSNRGGPVWGAVLDGVWSTTALIDNGLLVVTFGEDPAGEVYLADASAGDIYRVVASRTADLSLVLTDDPDPVLEGGLITYTAVIRSRGPAAAPRVRLRRMSSANVVFVGGRGCTLNLYGEPYCEVGTLAAGGVATVTVRFRATAGATASAIFRVTANVTEGDEADNTAVATTAILPPPGAAEAAIIVGPCPSGPPSIRARRRSTRPWSGATGSATSRPAATRCTTTVSTAPSATPPR
jgi:glucose/arabinose dehydrogenase